MKINTRRQAAILPPKIRGIMLKLWEKLKQRWGINNNWQVTVILIAFALTGFSTLYVHRWIDGLLGIDGNTSFFIKAVVFVFIVLPVFNALLLVWGSLLGQKEFVFKFVKDKLRLIMRGKVSR
jgi:predicted membrane protein